MSGLMSIAGRLGALAFATSGMAVMANESAVHASAAPPTTEHNVAVAKLSPGQRVLYMHLRYTEGLSQENALAQAREIPLVVSAEQMQGGIRQYVRERSEGVAAATTKRARKAQRLAKIAANGGIKT